MIIAAPHTAATPAPRMDCANEADAIVAPAVVDAVAAHINVPERGAIMVPPLLQPASRFISMSFIVEAFITPAKAPVPIRSMAMVDILPNP